MSPEAKFALRVVLFLFSMGDFILDWIFYVDAHTINQGLVYGRVEPTQVTAFLVFCIFGSVLFIADLVAFSVTVKEILKIGRNENRDAYKLLLSAIATVFEDIPQQTINVYIFYCREKGISVFQTLIAVVSLFIFVKDVYSIVEYYLRYKTCRLWVLIVTIIHCLGLAALVGLSIYVFIISQYEKKEDYGRKFRKPSNYFRTSVNDQKYFADVGVFLRDAGLPNTLKGDNRSDNWMHLFPIYELKEAKKISLKLTYSHANNHDFNMGIWLQAISADTKSWNLSDCYNINQDTATTTPQSSVICLADVASGANFGAIYMDFRFQFPVSNWFVKKLVFGEIYFNWKISTNGSCMSWDSFVSSVNDQRPNISFLSYFRVNNSSTLYTNKYFYSDDRNGTRYFSAGLGDIVSVDEIWKTGWKNCPSTGSMSPVFDTHMNIECN